jgi:hypothetical protein
MFKKATLSPSQPWPAETGLSTGKAAHCLLRPAGRHPYWARGAYTGVPEHDKGATRLREITKAGRNASGLPAEA